MENTTVEVAPEAPPVVPLLGVVAPTPLVMPKKKPRTNEKERDDGTE